MLNTLLIHKKEKMELYIITFYILKSLLYFKIISKNNY